MQININSKRSINKKLFMNFLLKFTIDSGLIGINQSKINWSNYANFQISESLFYAENNNLYLRGKVTLNIENLDEIYRFFNTPKKSRTILKKIEFDFKYNIDQEEMYINAIKVDNEINESLVSYLSKPISKKKLFNNKIYFKNLFNKIFQLYAG